jgi:hypothetical protein
MQKLLGVVCLVIGVMLLVWAHDSAQSFNSQLSNLINGNPTNRTMYLYAGGAALSISGLVQILWIRK